MNTIQATELRIGNFIGMNLEEYPNNFFTALEVGETMKVYDGLITLEGATIKRVETSFMYVDDFEPIPLNEDWLVKFGFLRFRGGYQLNEIKDFGIYFKVINERTDGKEIVALVDLESKIVSKEIHFVHQLQNLYHALTGEELTLTDK